MLIDDVERVLRDRSGGTATELARALYGSGGYQERINPALRMLCASGRASRQGSGGPGDPYRYFPNAADPPAPRGEQQATPNPEIGTPRVDLR